MTDARPVGRPPARLSGFVIILVATGIAGVISYVVTILVPNRVGPALYVPFAVFWSSIYLVVGALGGIQQEVTRGTHPVSGDGPYRVSRARNFGLVAGLTVLALVLATAPLWVRAAFPTEGWALVPPLAIGTSSFVMVAVLAGSLYGVSAWTPIALMITVDALLRLIGLAIALAFTTDVVVLAWAVALPFPVTLIVLWPFIRPSIVGRSQLDVGYRALTWNVARTVVAATATGIMVSGFPLMLGLTSHSVPRALQGMFVLAITLTRAPLIVVAMSLQSYLVVQFRNHSERFWRQFLRLLGIVAAGGAVLAFGGWLLGPAIYGLISPTGPQPDGPFFAILVASSALVAALCITAPAVLARSQHLVYTAGWVAGAVVTVAALLLPLDFATRTICALVAGPIVGLLVHGTYLVSAGLRERRAR
ncbi:hypothetical protein [Lacisediminihabitans changchengi]|uniref:Polysaccharide biosynthesis protein n=1 Tax=Lacisediminihabitans changchengi TaxID=2787634 RepID=A0A934VZ99_9MICO|nr:hypothetical protein [Lacisediminihabitans changchengi]MBK4346455.1 hypothetical protein [Lacisediminihabitans changchengi]MBK4348917.1 hypothetical protein [Lacisediminihabitans changchengi]